MTGVGRGPAAGAAEVCVPTFPTAAAAAAPPPHRRKGAVEEEEQDEDDWVLPEGVEPFLAAAPLYTGKGAGLWGWCAAQAQRAGGRDGGTA